MVVAEARMQWMEEEAGIEVVIAILLFQKT